MPVAYPTGSSHVINLGGGGRHDYLMAALEEMQKHQQQTEDEQRQAAQLRAQGFYKKLPADLTSDEMGTAFSGYAAADPAAAEFLPKSSGVPQTPGSHFKRFIDQWHDKMMPAFVDALQNTPEKVDPQMFMTLYPYLSAGDKAMDPGIVSFLTDRYIAANEGKLPADFVQQYKYKAKLQQTPQEIEAEKTTQRGQDIGLQGEQYKADQSLKGTQYGVDARRPVYAAEAGELTQKGRMYGTRADQNAEELGPDMEMVDNHPAVQAAQAHVTDLQQQRNQALIEARTAGKNNNARAAAQERADQLTMRISQTQQGVSSLRTKMAKSMGVDLGDQGGNDEPDSALGGEGDSAPGRQPVINDMRGGNVPSRPSGSARQQPPPAVGPARQSPPVGAGAPPAAGAPVQQGPDPQLLQQLRARKAAGQKVLKKSEFDQLRAAGIDTTGWQVVGQ